MALSDQDLSQLVAGGEGDRVEFKERLTAGTRDGIAEAICAFANDLPDHRRPGVVVVGLRDDGSPAGTEPTDELLRQLAELRTDGRIVPRPSMSVERRALSGAATAVVVVEPSDSPPVRFKGGICVRTGSRRDYATAQDERRLTEKRRHRDLPFDINPVPSSAVADLSIRRFEEEYLPAALAPDVIAANDRTVEERLAATKMIASPDDPTPTVLGHLVLGIRATDFLPGAYVQFLRFAGSDDTSDILDEARMDGAVTQLLGRLEDKISAHNRVGIDISAERERRQETYPVEAVRQFVRNAVMHRVYEGTNAPIRVYWYEDRLEIISPGGPFGVVTPENFGRPGITDYRNPNLAEAARVLGFVQRFGIGIPIARRALAGAGLPDPAFTADAHFVTVTLRRAS